MNARGTDKLSFGSFEFEPRTGRLYKHGLRLRLQPKSAAVLECLLERPQEVVTREQLQRRLWPDGTHVDFGLGIKVAVKKLRDAVGDSADEPVYVQTVPGRGYRFIGTVGISLPAPAETPRGAPKEDIAGDLEAPHALSVQPTSTDHAARPWSVPLIKRRIPSHRVAGLFAALGFACLAILIFGPGAKTSRSLLSARARSTPGRRFVYVTDYSQNRVLGFSVNPNNGHLEGLATTSARSGEHPYGAAFFPNNGFLYVTNRGLADGVCGNGCNISAYAVDQVSGKLDELPGSPFPSGSGPVAIVGHPSGKVLYVANVISNDVYAYVRDESGGLRQVGPPVPVGARPFFLGTVPSGRFLYAVNQDDATISGFSVGKDGKLDAIGGSPFRTGLRPRTFTVDASGRFVYVVNYGVDPYAGHDAACSGAFGNARGKGCSISIFSVDAETGFLAEIAGSPVDVHGTNPLFSLLDSQGKYLFVVNVGSSNISVFRRNEVTGAIREVPDSPFTTNEGPVSAAIDWSDDYLYVLSGYTPTISQFNIDAGSGRLSPAGTPIRAGVGLSEIVAQRPF